MNAISTCMATVAMTVFALDIVSSASVQGQGSTAQKPGQTVPASAGTARKPAARVAPPPPFTVDEVLLMIGAGLSEEVIAAKLRQHGKPFNLTAKQMIQLKDAKASDYLITMLMDPDAQPPRPTAAVAASPDGYKVSAPATLPAASATGHTETAPVQTPSGEAAVSESTRTERRIPNLASYNELKSFIKERYDGQQLVVMKEGMLAGEYEKQFFGGGNASLVYLHYAPDLDVPKRIRTPEGIFGRSADSLNQLDDRTWSQLQAGLNVTKLRRGEVVRVNKFYMRSNYVEFFLEPLDPVHWQDLDMGRASTQTTRTSNGQGQTQSTTRVNGFGLRLVLYFSEQNTFKTGDAQMVVAEIDKFVMPKSDATAVLEAESAPKSITLGQTFSEVESILGKPITKIDLGAKVTYVYKEMKITFVDGKVADVQ